MNFGSSSVDPIGLVDAPPRDPFGLLEFGLDWDPPGAIESSLAAAVRIFVLTRDPLDWLADRAGAWATAKADGDTWEIPVYVTRGELLRRMRETEVQPQSVLGHLGETVVQAAAQYQGSIVAGTYAKLAVRGAVPGLLDHPTTQSGPRAIGVLRSNGWEPVGLGALQDLVQEAFGPVDFDRSAVTLPPAATHSRGCPACTGERFDFPGALAEAQPLMCDEHRAAASVVTTSRIDRARSSNRAGWRALGKGSARISGVSEPGGTPVPQRRRGGAGRNEPCPCGSGRKYKLCCGR